ncbi:hypothetical protein [Nonomuraea cavernae]|uniref:Uncharacterized protein n=1 Tax=Nonomuraea cavernae TaxID=2045107 RepID=A0A918DP02_9ACTN|nr:hypothetical protein [Nonomuraea cavernae]MCA2189800.1 hypothetical protein [Nonomuraea cavernae]GGO77526.1 hypothetical protein GCM10012289_57390 [Nonomuraea cavernae]
MNSYERRCRLLLQAYPSRYRQARGEELIGTLLDLAEPERAWPTLRDSLDVVRGGIVLRLRERPPLWHWARYRLLHKRLPYAYRWWARDDLVGKWYLARQYMAWLLLTSPLWTFIAPGGLLWGDLVIASALLLMVGYLSRPTLRRYQLSRHEFDHEGTPIGQ